MMELDFIDELPTVFNILKHNPEAIVDDTAIERLLNWLDEISSQKSKKLIDKSLEFFLADEIWNHTLTLSFVLRFAGFLGYHSGLSSEELTEVVVTLLQKVTEHKQFKEATVQYGFFRCLASLSKDVFWCKKLEFYLETTLEAFKKSYLFVKKAAITFFASFLQTSLSSATDCVALIKTNIRACTDSTVLQNITESVIQLCEKNIDIGLKFLYNSNLLTQLIFVIKEQHTSIDVLQLLDAFICLISVLNSCGRELDWGKVLSVPDENVESHFHDLVEFTTEHKNLHHFIPTVCESLIHHPLNNKFFSLTWNTCILQTLLCCVMHDECLYAEVVHRNHVSLKDKLSIKSWKKQLLVTINMMCKVRKKVAQDPVCQKVINAWTSFCMKILIVSMNANVNEPVDEYLLSVIDDKKMTRLCFLYLKDMEFKGLDRKIKIEFVSCIWSCLSSCSDSAQIICNGLDLLSKFVREEEGNFLQLTCQQETVLKFNDDKCVTLAGLLNMKLWDINWEVKDSLIAFLMEMVDGARKGYQSYLDFMEKESFWCNTLGLLDDNESYVRSKTVAFLGEIVLFPPVWKMFCRKNTYSIIALWQRLESIFTSTSRQDDMFTRRAILKIIKSWINANQLDEILCAPAEKLTNTDTRAKEFDIITDTETIRILLFNILENGYRDFDWEVRKLTIDVWINAVDVFSNGNDNYSSSETFFALFIENNFAFMICDAVLDPEYRVRLEALNCLRKMGKMLLNKDNRPAPVEISNEPINETAESPKLTMVHHCNNVNHSTEVISSFDQFEHSLKSRKHISQQEFLQLLAYADFESLLRQIDVLDVTVKSDPVSFLHDIIASAKQSDVNLLDCY